MADRSIVPWDARRKELVPKGATTASEIAPLAQQLAPREIKQIISAFEAEHYEMATTFVWSKAMAALRNQLGTLGSEFVGEMLQRPDIDEHSDIAAVVTDAEALALAEDLGMISATECMRLRQAHEVIRHFAGTTGGDPEEDISMRPEEAIGCLRACIHNILAEPKLDVAQDFAEFRRRLEETTLADDDESLELIGDSPYFYKKTTLSVLLALLKTAEGAQLEHVGRNTTTIIPSLWPGLKKAEKWQAGQTYAELYADGKKSAFRSLRTALVAVSGFDFVPETLRSNTFTRAAKDVLQAHEGMNNFYNEPRPMQVLAQLGTTIPGPAFPVCMTATLAVRLGNTYGHSWSAQPAAEQILRGLIADQWKYYLDDCLPTDRTILVKLMSEKPQAKWTETLEEFNISPELVNDKDVKGLIEASLGKRASVVNRLALHLYARGSKKRT